MATKIKLGDREYDVDNLSEKTKTSVALLKFATARIKELTSFQAILQSARQNHIDKLKKEVISKKAGFVFEED